MPSGLIIQALALRSTLVFATPSTIQQRAAPRAFSTFTHNPVYYPLQQAPYWRVGYARAIQLADNSLLATWEDYPYGVDAAHLDTFKIIRSVDGGATWSHLSQVADTQNGWGMRSQPDMYILKAAHGTYPAGTLLIAGVSSPLRATPGVYIDLYSSADSGRTWSFASHIVYGDGPEDVETGRAAIWEPFFLENNGRLLVYFSDQRDKAHSQKLSVSFSSDLKTWSESSDVVAYRDLNARPGMAVISYITATKQYMLSYELCNAVVAGCAATYRLAPNPLKFLSATDHTVRTTTGHIPRGSPYNIWYQYPNSLLGSIILSTRSDSVLFVSKDNAQTWTTVNKGQDAGYSRHLMLFNDGGVQRLHVISAGFYGCSGSCYNYVTNGVSDLTGF